MEVNIDRSKSKKINELIKVKEQEIAESQKELAELEQEYEFALREYHMGIAEHPQYSMSGSISLKEWRIGILYEQKQKLEDEFND